MRTICYDSLGKTDGHIGKTVNGQRVAPCAHLFGVVVQFGLERLPVTQEVAGSSPVSSANAEDRGFKSRQTNLFQLSFATMIED